MRTYFDSSALVPLLLRRSRFHAAATAGLKSAAKDAVTSTHALAETFRTLTSLTPDPLPPKAARVLVHSLDKIMEVRALSRKNYDATLAVMAAQGLSGPIVYDALHCQSAMDAGAKRILTRNAKHLGLFANGMRVEELGE